MPTQRAKRTSWSNGPLPAERERIEFDQIYSSEAFQKITKGYIPNELEDPWFMFFEDDCLYIHPNDGIGQCVYEVHFERKGNEYRIAEIWASRDKRQSLPSEDKSLLRFADSYNIMKSRSGEQEIRVIPIGAPPHASEENRPLATRDISLLQYLIDHWLVWQPWKR